MIIHIGYAQSYQVLIKYGAAQAFDFATFVFSDFDNMNPPYCIQLNFILLPPSARHTHLICVQCVPAART